MGEEGVEPQFPSKKSVSPKGLHEALGRGIPEAVLECVPIKTVVQGVIIGQKLVPVIVRKARVGIAQEGRQIIEGAKRLNIPILQASTSEVYGDPKEHPQKESYWGNVNPIGPRSCYDEGKRAAETLFHDYREQLSLDTKVVRIFNTYGPRMSANDGRVVSNFTRH